ncbi:MAG: hypothetical protein J6Z00_04495 [Clostridia bacterium]|nr:hypothetical protein [Clostridia bacterium]
MKKTISIVMAMAFIVCMMSILTITPSAKDYNGPSGSGDDFIYMGNDLDPSDPDYVEARLYSGKNKYITNTLDGVSYDKKSNTLTLNNANYPTSYLEINEMGKNFTMKLIGTSSLQSLACWGYDHNGSLTITGSGTLKLNANKQCNYIPFILDAEFSASSLTIAPTASLLINSQASNTPSIRIADTSLGSNAVVGFKKAFTSTKKQWGNIISVGYYAEEDLYVFPATPKASSEYDQAGTYYACNNFSSVTSSAYTIFQLVYDSDLEVSVAKELSDKKGNVANCEDFTINTGSHSYVDFIYPGGFRESYTSNGFTYIVDDMSGYYNIYRVYKSAIFGNVLSFVGNFDEIPNYYTKDAGKPYYTYDFIGNFSQKGTYLAKGTDGKWYYYKEGKKAKDTLLFNHTDGKYYYVNNGVVNKSATKLVKHTDGKWYYVKNGVVTKSTLLFKHTDGKYYYVKNGVVTKSTLLFKHTDKKFYYVKNGVVTKATLLFKHTDGKWYYVKNSVVTKSTLIYKFNGAKRYIKAGVWQSGFTGKVKIGGTTYNVKKGNVA